MALLEFQVYFVVSMKRKKLLKKGVLLQAKEAILHK
jgi:hypothetical protein